MARGWVDSWVATRDELARTTTYAGLLSPDELARAAAGRRSGPFVAGAVLLRLAVCRRTGVAPEAVRVRRCCPECGGFHGRPELPGTGLTASISHSGDLVAVAVTDAGWVGVDVEVVREVPPSLLSRVLSAHERGLATDAASFFAIWTIKEALLKASGQGVGGIGDHLVEGLDPVQVVDSRARVESLPVPDGFAGALAVLRGVEWQHSTMLPAS
ncbi:MAG: 4'-phosphopantetheinyl transferase superfamily protein [Nocardioides sp.]